MYNEMSADDRTVRAPYDKVAEWINAAGVDLLKLRQSEAEAIFREPGNKEYLAVCLANKAYLLASLILRREEALAAAQEAHVLATEVRNSSISEEMKRLFQNLATV